MSTPVLVLILLLVLTILGGLISCSVKALNGLFGEKPEEPTPGDTTPVQTTVPPETEPPADELLKQADPARKPLRKTRYCLTYDNQYFEIDLYPFWKDQAIMEIELCEEDAELNFPAEITIIKEVTDDEAYKNASLAEIK